MDVVAAVRDVGTYRGAAEICGVDPKPVKRRVLAQEAGDLDEERASEAPVPKNIDIARALAAHRVEATKGKITAKRLLVEARAVGYAGTSGAWSRRRRRRGAPRMAISAGRRCGPRATQW